MEPVLCTSCGHNIGAKMPLYDKLADVLRDSIELKHPEIGAESLIFSPDTVFETGPIMDALGLVNECCRVAMLSKIKMSKLR